MYTMCDDLYKYLLNSDCLTAIKTVREVELQKNMNIVECVYQLR